MIQHCWTKYPCPFGQDAKEKHALKFRLQSAFSFDLISTYVELGFMAKIPKNMETWSKKLFDILTGVCQEVTEFQKLSTNNYTSSNIPVLVAILVYLESKSVLCCSGAMSTQVTKHFTRNGLYKKTKDWLALPAGR